MNGLNFHEEMVAKISNGSEIGSLGKTYTQSYNDWLDKHDAEIRADERRKFAEWMYKVQYHGADADMEERKNYTIRRWIEDFEQKQKGETE